MDRPPFTVDPKDCVAAILYIASLIHVFWESRRKQDAPIVHTLMVALVLWPLSYLFWVLWWPGSLRKWMLRKFSSGRS